MFAPKRLSTCFCWSLFLHPQLTVLIAMPYRFSHHSTVLTPLSKKFQPKESSEDGVFCGSKPLIGAQWHSLQLCSLAASYEYSSWRESLSPHRSVQKCLDKALHSETQSYVFRECLPTVRSAPLIMTVVPKADSGRRVWQCLRVSGSSCKIQVKWLLELHITLTL